MHDRLAQACLISHVLAVGHPPTHSVAFFGSVDRRVCVEVGQEVGRVHSMPATKRERLGCREGSRVRRMFVHVAVSVLRRRSVCVRACVFKKP